MARVITNPAGLSVSSVTESEENCDACLPRHHYCNVQKKRQQQLMQRRKPCAQECDRIKALRFEPYMNK